jgi:hypothetical protein
MRREFFKGRRKNYEGGTADGLEVKLRRKKIRKEGVRK